jgi:hypothetical protein
VYNVYADDGRPRLEFVAAQEKRRPCDRIEGFPMRLGTRIITAIAFLTSLSVLTGAMACSVLLMQDEDLQALEGEWLYVEDQTEGRPAEEQQPPMSVLFALRVEDDAVVMLRGKGTNQREMRLALDGSTTELTRGTSISRYTSTWKDGALVFDTELLHATDGSRIAHFTTELRRTNDGLLVRVEDGVALYRQPQQIALPKPAEAKIGDLAWMGGAWLGTRGRSSIEERWTPPLGGAMLGVSRTVSRESMVAFEFLRVVERDGGLVYIAQPGGTAPTEFVLTEVGAARAVFENPRHDSPQRIVYELSAEGVLVASIGFSKGGRPQRFEFRREGE